MVDDEQSVRMNPAPCLKDEGFEAPVVSSAEDALAALARGGVYVGIIDMRLPGLDGNALVLRAHAMRPEMKLLIHTGSANYRHIARHAREA